MIFRSSLSTMCDRPLQVLIALMTLACLAQAEDRLQLRTASGSRIGVACSISDSTGREVVYQTKAGGPIKRVPRRDVLEISTSYNVSHTAGRELLSRGQAQAAFDKLDQALDEENRTWVRREILATLIRCALWDGNRIAAGERFLAIGESDPETMYFPLMPLSWNDAPPGEGLQRAARSWLTQTSSPAAQLLGASHLLTDPKHAAEALRVLKGLAKETQVDLQRLGQMQLWRAKVLT